MQSGQLNTWHIDVGVRKEAGGLKLLGFFEAYGSGDFSNYPIRKCYSTEYFFFQPSSFCRFIPLTNINLSLETWLIVVKPHILYKPMFLIDKCRQGSHGIGLN